MPVFNVERHVRAAIDSILAQTFSDFELIIVNDGSHDRTGEILGSFTDARIRTFENDQNLGIVASLNHALQLCRSEFIARMDGDDVSLPNRLIEQYRFLKEHPEIGVAGSAVQLIDQDSQPIRIGKYPTDPEFARWILIFTNPVAHPSVMMRKSIVQAVGGYLNCLAEDIDLWDRMSQSTQITNLPSVLIQLRKHTQNKTISDKSALLADAAVVSTRLISRITGQVPRHDLVLEMYSKEIYTPTDALEIASLIQDVLAKYIASPGLLPATKRLIRRDAARRILRLSSYRKIPTSIRGQLVWSACKLDPLVPMRALKSRSTMWQL